MTIKDQLTTINQWPDRDGHNIEGIVIHSADGFFNGTISWFRNPKAKASTHYVISDKGDIAKCVEERAAAWHAGVVTVSKEEAPRLIRERWGINPNLITVGIEMEDKRNRKWKYPNSQYFACVELVADICKRNNIDPDRGVLIMHKEIDPVNRFDPVGDWKHEQFVSDVRKFMDLKPVETEKEIKLKVMAQFGLNIRAFPTRDSAKRGCLKLNTVTNAYGYTLGETIDGNNEWWLIHAFNPVNKLNEKVYIWSGGVDLKPSDYLKGGKNMNLTEYEAKKAELETKKSALDAEQKDIETRKGSLVSEEEAFVEKLMAYKNEKADFDATVPEEEQPVEVETPAVNPIDTPVEAVAETPEVVEEPAVVEEKKVTFDIDENLPADIKDKLARINSLILDVKDFIK